MTSDFPTKQGFLRKVGGVIKSWHKRWFELKNNSLLYYDPSLIEPGEEKGRIDLTGMDPTMVTEGDQAQFEFAIGCVAPPRPRTYMVRATSIAERDEWMDIIRASISVCLDRDAPRFALGDRVLAVDTEMGTVRYVGTAQFASGMWVGLALDNPLGKNDGSVQGVRYFQCKMLHGLFIRPNRCKLATAAPPEPTITSEPAVAAAPQPEPVVTEPLIASQPDPSSVPTTATMTASADIRPIVMSAHMISHEIIHTFEHAEEVRCVAMTEGIVVTGSVNSQICLYAIDSAECVSTYTPCREIICGIAVTEDFDALAVAAETDIFMLDASTGETRTRGSCLDARCVSFFDENDVVFGGRKMFAMYDVRDLRKPTIDFSEHISDIALSCSASGFLAAACDKAGVSVYDTRKSSQVLKQAWSPYPCVHVSNASVCIADQGLRLWNGLQPEEPAKLLATLPKHADCIYSSGQRVAVGDSSERVLMFDKESGECVMEVAGARSKDVVFDEAYLAYVSEKKVIVVEYESEY